MLVGLSVVIVITVKPPEPIEMPFGIWTRVGPRKHVLGGHVDAVWRIRVNRLYAVAMRLYVKLL